MFTQNLANSISLWYQIGGEFLCEPVPDLHGMGS